MDRTPELYEAVLKAETLPQTCLLLAMFKIEHPELEELWQKVATRGIKLGFHFREVLDKEQIGASKAWIGDRSYDKWEYWEELDQRMSLAKQAMLEIMDEEQDPLNEEEAEQ